MNVRLFKDFVIFTQFSGKDNSVSKKDITKIIYKDGFVYLICGKLGITYSIKDEKSMYWKLRFWRRLPIGKTVKSEDLLDLFILR